MANNYFLRNASVLIDANADGNKYIGEAVPGQDTVAGRALAQWSIIRISTTGTVKSITYANGDNDFIHVWDDRTTLGYS